MIVGIYLAAGKSSRFGSNKIAHRLGKVSLGSMGLRVALQTELDKVIVVVRAGDDVGWVPPDLRVDEKVEFVVATDADKGQAHSIYAGLKRAVDLGADAVVIMLADQPLITVALINRLIGKYIDDSSLEFVGARYEGIFAPPLLLTAKLYDALSGLTGDIGARRIIIDRLEKGFMFEWVDARVSFDVDRRTDVEELDTLSE